jgi:hypothetical protein
VGPAATAPSTAYLGGGQLTLKAGLPAEVAARDATYCRIWSGDARDLSLPIPRVQIDGCGVPFGRARFPTEG